MSHGAAMSNARAAVAASGAAFVRAASATKQTSHSSLTSSAVAMASRNPAAFLGLERRLGRIAVGLEADLVALGVDGDVQTTWIGGVASSL